MGRNSIGSNKISENEFPTSRKACGSLQSHIFLLAIFIGRVCQGMFWSIFSPTILFLADNVSQTVGSVSPMFTGRSLGFMLGALSAGFLFKFRNPLMTIGLAVLVCSVLLFAVPFVQSFALLFFLVTLCGIMVGYFDAGLQGMLLNIWGLEKSRVYIQLFHLAFSVGTFVAPLIAKPFLEAASLVKKQEAICPHYNNTQNVSSTTTNGSFVTNANIPAELSFNGINPTSYVFIITGLYAFVVAVWLLILAVMRIPTKIKEHRITTGEKTEYRKNDPLKDVFVFFLLITLFYIFLIGGEHPYVAFIYAIAVCSKLSFSVAKATLINSLFWAGFVVGRVIASLAARFFHPSKIILFCVSGSVVTVLLMVLFGENVDAIVWVTAFFYGFLLAPIYASFISWISQYTNISGKYIFIINLGNGIGSMTMIPVGGAIFEIDPFSVTYFMLGMISMNLVAFVVLIFYAKYCLTKKMNEDNNKKHIVLMPIDSANEKPNDLALRENE